MESIAALLNNYLKSSKQDKLFNNIARFMLSNMDSLYEMKREEIARACHVSNPSVTRFIKELGFDDYGNFKYMLLEQKKQLNNQFLKKTRQECLIEAADYEKIDFFADTLKKTVGNALKKVDQKKVCKLSAEIIKHSYIVCIGAGNSGMFGDFLNNRLNMKAKGIQSIGVPDMEYPLTGDKKNTLVIVVSQRGGLLKSVYGLSQYLKRNADRVWMITQSDKRIEDTMIDEIIYLEKSGYYSVDYHVILAIAEMISYKCEKYL